MSDKAKMGTFMGYGEDTEGYKVLLNGRIVLSRDVRFNEELRGPEAICGRTPAVSRGGAVGSPTPFSPTHLSVHPGWRTRTLGLRTGQLSGGARPLTRAPGQALAAPSTTLPPRRLKRP